MKKTIRLGTFETNSSSAHSLIVLTPEDYEKWRNGEILYDGRTGGFVSEEEAEKRLEDTDQYSEGDIVSYDDFCCCKGWFSSYQTDVNKITTPGGEELFIACYYAY